VSNSLGHQAATAARWVASEAPRDSGRLDEKDAEAEVCVHDAAPGMRRHQTKAAVRPFAELPRLARTTVTDWRSSVRQVVHPRHKVRLAVKFPCDEHGRQLDGPEGSWHCLAGAR